MLTCLSIAKKEYQTCSVVAILLMNMVSMIWLPDFDHLYVVEHLFANSCYDFDPSLSTHTYSHTQKDTTSQKLICVMLK